MSKEEVNLRFKNAPRCLLGEYARATKKCQKASRNYNRLLVTIRIPSKPFVKKWNNEQDDHYVFTRDKLRAQYWGKLCAVWHEELNRVFQLILSVPERARARNLKRLGAQ